MSINSVLIAISAAVMGAVIVQFFPRIWFFNTHSKKDSSQKDFLKLILNRLPDLIWIKDSEGKFLACNERFEALYGASESKIIGKTDYDFVEKDIADYFRNNDNDAIREGGPRKNEEIVTFRSDGHTEYLETIKTPIFRDDMSLIGVLGIGRNITQRKGFEDELVSAKESAEAYASLLNEAQSIGKMGNWTLDFVTNELKWSDQIYTIFGKERSHFEPSYENFLAVVHPDDREEVNQAFTSHLSEKSIYDHVHRIQVGANQIKYVHEKCSTIFSEDGAPLKSIGTVQDITERVSYEKVLIAARKKAEISDKFKDELINNISHEIRTPMNGIIGFSDILQSHCEDQDVKFYVETIKKSSNQLLKIIEDIIEISELNTGQAELVKTPFSLDAVWKKIKETYYPISEEKGLSLEMNITNPHNFNYIHSDQSRIFKILAELVDNALKYTTKGKVTLEAKVSFEGLEISVEDTGQGIDPSVQNKIFNKFSRGSFDFKKMHGGLGLGLSIVQENCKLLEGRIELVKSSPEGTKFKVSLPITTIENTTDSQKKKEKFSAPVILVAEDEIGNYKYIKHCINIEFGNETSCIHANNGKEAVELAESRKDIDLILMDIKMPGMNGLEAAELIRRNNSSVPIIAQTAHPSVGIKKEALASGCNDLILKPMTKNDLTNIINQWR